MTITDWRHHASETLAPLLAAEADRWRRLLYWETGGIWQGVERARRAGVLPGFLATAPDGQIAGWSFHARQGRQVQIGGLTAGSPETTEELLDAVWRSPETQAAETALVFGPFAAPGMERALAHRGADVDRYRYLARDIPGAPTPRDSTLTRPWRCGDLAGTVGVLAAAHGPDKARPFAPDGRPADWMAYVDHLLNTGGCGDFDAALSRAVDGAAGQMDGVALVTRLGPATVHLAQLAVRPGVQRRGVGSRLLSAVVAAAAASGAIRLTLLVGARNTRAVRLYERWGFVETSVFLSASCPRTGRD